MTTTEHVPVDHLPHAKDLVTPLPYAESELRTRIAEAIGAATSCWENLGGAGVFDSSRAGQICDDLTAHVLRLTGMGNPSLGCATTKELIDELASRASVSETIGEDWPKYRTVDS
jgi:hypothetical protein